MKTTVIGAGGGGIASALLAALRGEDVTLYEAHSEIGGCASYFKRGHFVFDIGATTLSGLAPNEPLGKLFSLLSNFPSLELCDPGMVLHLSDGRKVFYHKDFERWMKELETHFPHLAHRIFWEKLKKINLQGWDFLGQVDTFPFQGLADLKPLLKQPKHLKILPSLFVSLDMSLKQHGLDDHHYRELIDGILLISAQAKSESIPLLVGAMGLMYPAQTYAPVGGMKGLMDYFESEMSALKIKLHKKSKVNHFHQLQSDRFILNLTSWNLNQMGLAKKETAQAWGAFTIYLGVQTSVKEIYHQIHLGDKEVKNYFVSFSIPNDFKRAPEGWRTVSISTHVHTSHWINLSRADYENEKKRIEELILKDFLKRFDISQTKFISSGTPKTFEFYTGRKNGFVGGLPFLYGKNPWRLNNFFLGKKETYRVGDTVFPGQGLCGVVAGALGLHRYLLKLKP